MQRFFRFPLLALLATLARAADPDAVVHVSLTAPGYTSANAPEFARVKYNKAAPLGIVSDDMGVGESRLGEAGPGEERPGVDLAVGRDVGMPDELDAGMARGEVAAERENGAHLSLGERVGRPGVDDLDADRDAVHVVLAAPRADAGVPRALVLGDEAVDAAVAVHHVVRAHLAGGVAEDVERLRERLRGGLPGLLRAVV